MAKKNGKFVAEFGFRNPTKRMWRFEETSKTGMNTIYLPQSAFEKEPQKIRVTVEVIA
jgi:hypothetical protein